MCYYQRGNYNIKTCYSKLYYRIRIIIMLVFFFQIAQNMNL